MFKYLFCLLIASKALFASSIEGFWKTIDNDTGKARCILAIYPYDGMYYGRIIGTFNDQGVMDDTIYKPKGRAPGVVGDPFYCGLDIIWNLAVGGASYKGKILDPERGKVYSAELWTEGGNLIVRGKLMIFGRNYTWLPAADSDFPKDFKKPNLASLVPAVPETK